MPYDIRISSGVVVEGEQISRYSEEWIRNEFGPLDDVVSWVNSMIKLPHINGTGRTITIFRGDNKVYTASSYNSYYEEEKVMSSPGEYWDSHIPEGRS